MPSIVMRNSGLGSIRLHLMCICIYHSFIFAVLSLLFILQQLVVCYALDSLPLVERFSETGHEDTLSFLRGLSRGFACG